MINEFRGEYRWLSNFHGGVEQRYQAIKRLFHRQPADNFLVRDDLRRAI